MQRGTKEYRLKQSVYRLGYALYAKHFVTKDGRGANKDGVMFRDLVFDKWESLRTKLYKEYGQMW